MNSSSDTLLINRNEVASLLTIEECISAVEYAFKLRAIGAAQPPGILGVHAKEGGFHIKAGILDLGAAYFVAKTNANFPENKKKHGLPTIQGIIVVSNAQDGRLLALMDSIEITIIRTGAATGVAGKYLSRVNSKILTICGCGNQGRISLKALMSVRKIEKVFAYDVDARTLDRFVSEMSRVYNISILPVDELSSALNQSDIVITCTPSKKYFIQEGDIKAGAFIAAVGSDNEDKQEIDPVLLSKCKVIADSVDQCATIGELHHALDRNLMKRENVYGELGQVIAGLKEGRENDEEIIIFDSTGTALQDVAASAIVYEKAIKLHKGQKMNFAC
jgi:alanine dehydrogenase